jgi:hypothetical protein
MSQEEMSQEEIPQEEIPREEMPQLLPRSRRNYQWGQSQYR